MSVVKVLGLDELAQRLFANPPEIEGQWLSSRYIRGADSRQAYTPSEQAKITRWLKHRLTRAATLHQRLGAKVNQLASCPNQGMPS